MKLWGKNYSVDKKIDVFTVGNDREYDLVLAHYDVQASIAHAKMLAEVKIISHNEANSLIEALQEIGKDIEKGNFSIEQNFEDVHSKIEYLLTEKLGDTGKKIHAARSRNDQVLVALQLYEKAELETIIAQTKELFDLLILLAKKHQKVLLPGYTHLQVAMPSSFGLWFSAYAEMLIDDTIFLKATYKMANQNPLGSAAGYGSSFPIDRDLTTSLLSFETMKYNVIAAQMGRGKVEKNIAFAIANLASSLAKMAMDICLYMSQNFEFISFPKELTTGSSIMPHKKNPDVFELIRGKCNKLQAAPVALSALTSNLPSGYHRELQLTKEVLIPTIEDIKACLEMTIYCLEKIEVRTNILQDKKYDYLFSVEALNELVNKGIPFREAYQKIAYDIEHGHYKPNKSVNHTHKGSIGNLCLDEITQKMNEVISKDK